MSQHSQRTQLGPSRVCVVGSSALVVLSATATGYLFPGSGFNVRELVAFLLGAVLTGHLAVFTLRLAADRAVAQDRVQRAARWAQQATQRAQDAREHYRHWTQEHHPSLYTAPAAEPGPEPVNDQSNLYTAPAAEPEPVGPGYWSVPEPETEQTWRWWSSEPSQDLGDKPELQLVTVPLPVRAPVYPGYPDPDATQVIDQPGSGWHGDQTEVQVEPRYEDRSAATEVIDRVQ